MHECIFKYRIDQLRCGDAISVTTTLYETRKGKVLKEEETSLFNHRTPDFFFLLQFFVLFNKKMKTIFKIW